MDVLDQAKEYKIFTQRFYYRGPFGAIKDKVISETYNFRPVDTSDGLNYYALADIHMELNGSKKAADCNQDKELLVLAGDVISFVETHDDAFYTGKIAHAITKGEIPVVYARGNHEVKGEYAEQFYKYVGSKNENFYYSFYFENVYGLVLDLGEDHDDDWWEYYDTAYYDEYRDEQARFLETELARTDDKSYTNYNYRMLVSHIPVIYINSRGNHVAIKQELTSLLNQFNLDIALSGHQHDLWVFEPNTLVVDQRLPYNPDYRNGTNKGRVTDYNFPTFLISKRGLTQNDDESLTLKSQIGLTVKVDFAKNTETVIYNTSNGTLVNMVNPFKNADTGTTYSYGTEIVIDRATKEFQKK